MKYLVFLCFLLGLDASACLRMQGQISSDKNLIRIDQRFDHDQKYTYQVGVYHVTLEFSSQKKVRPETHSVNLNISKLQNSLLVPVAHKNIMIKEGQLSHHEFRDPESPTSTLLDLTLTQI
jgi:hypothetical protein